MNIPKKIIEKAIEGGWKGLFMDDEGITVDIQSQIAWGRTKTGLGRHLPLQVIALDPTFWQALGKTLGWSEQKTHFPSSLAKCVWQNTAYVFYDLILTGASTDEFWATLLK